jgi:hypothetical protein
LANLARFSPIEIMTAQSRPPTYASLPEVVAEALRAALWDRRSKRSKDGPPPLPEVLERDIAAAVRRYQQDSLSRRRKEWTHTQKILAASKKLQHEITAASSVFPSESERWPLFIWDEWNAVAPHVEKLTAMLEDWSRIRASFYVGKQMSPKNSLRLSVFGALADANVKIGGSSQCTAARVYAVVQAYADGNYTATDVRSTAIKDSLWKEWVAQFRSFEESLQEWRRQKPTAM